MLNPRQLAAAIDGTIARHRRTGPVDSRIVAREVLSSLPREDRGGIEPEMLTMIVAVRSLQPTSRDIAA